MFHVSRGLWLGFWGAWPNKILSRAKVTSSSLARLALAQATAYNNKLNNHETKRKLTIKHTRVVGEVHFGYPNLYSNTQFHKSVSLRSTMHEATVKGTESRDFTETGYYLLGNLERCNKLSKLYINIHISFHTFQPVTSFVS